MKIDCLLCSDTVSLNKLIYVEHKTKEDHGYICFSCIRYINTLVANKYREHGWHVTKDALIVNNDSNKGEAA